MNLIFYIYCEYYTFYPLSTKPMLTTIKKGSTKEEVIKKAEKQLKKKSLNIRKYCGILSIEKDPVALQKVWRDEWK